MENFGFSAGSFFFAFFHRKSREWDFPSAILYLSAGRTVSLFPARSADDLFLSDL